MKELKKKASSAPLHCLSTSILHNEFEAAVWRKELPHILNPLIPGSAAVARGLREAARSILTLT
jgi:hypothetical protein